MSAAFTTISSNELMIVTFFEPMARAKAAIDEKISVYQKLGHQLLESGYTIVYAVVANHPLATGVCFTLKFATNARPKTNVGPTIEIERKDPPPKSGNSVI